MQCAQLKIKLMISIRLEPGPEELPSQDFNSVLGFRVSFEIATGLGFHHRSPIDARISQGISKTM